MSVELDEYVKNNMSNFDRTDIAHQLRNIEVPLELYIEIKEKLYNRLIAIKQIKSPIEDHILDAKKSVDKAVQLFMDTW